MRSLIKKIGEYNFYDSSNDYSRLLKTFQNGAFIISAFRQAFGRNGEPETFNLIKNQLDEFGIVYTDSDINDYMNNTNSARFMNYYNKCATNNLENELRSLGFGFRVSLGGYQEKGQTQGSEEISFIVPYQKEKMTEEEFTKIAVKLCNKYYQDSVLVILSWMENAVWLNNNSDIVAIFNKKPRISGETDFYTETKKTNSPRFSFDGEEFYDSKMLADKASKNHLGVYSAYSTRMRNRFTTDGWNNTNNAYKITLIKKED